jgi:hypothetical protein
MRKLLIVVAIGVVLVPGTAGAQPDGVRLEGGPVFLTKSGSLPLGASAIESDAGFAFRGRLRVGIGAFSLAGEVQASSQKYGSPEPGAPQDLDATLLAVALGFHPFTLLRLTPYAELGRGRLSLSDPAIDGDRGFRATSYGLGTFVALTDRVGLDVSLRLVRQAGLRLTGLGQELKYDPKQFAVTLSIRL